MKVKFIHAEPGNVATNTTVELSEAEAVKAVMNGDAILALPESSPKDQIPDESISPAETTMAGHRPKPVAETLADIPPDIRKRANLHIKQAGKSKLAPEWKNARLSKRADTLYRPDISDPAYYVLYVEAGGQPRGYLVLSSDTHDYPVVCWSPKGTSPADILRKKAEAEGRQPVRFYRTDVHYVAEGMDGEVAASTAPGFIRLRSLKPQEGERISETRVAEPVPVSWQEEKENFAALHGAYLQGLHRRAAAAWETSGSPGVSKFRSKKHIPCMPPLLHKAGGRAGDTLDVKVLSNESLGPTPPYRQLEPNEGPSDWSYHSGCGATAWAIIFAWASQQAMLRRGLWANYTALVRHDGMDSKPADWPPWAMVAATDELLPNGVAWYDEAAKKMTWDISNIIQTHMWGTSGWAAPNQVDDVQDYITNLGITESQLKAWTNHIGGAHTDDILNSAIDLVASYRIPAMVGIGDLSHYAVATQWTWDQNTQTHQFWLNMGHGGWDDAWHVGDFFLAGTIIPQQAPQPYPRYQQLGIQIVSATYGGVAQDPKPDVTAQLAWQWNNHIMRDVSVNTNLVMTDDPAPGQTKILEVSYTCLGEAGTPVRTVSANEGDPICLTSLSPGSPTVPGMPYRPFPLWGYVHLQDRGNVDLHDDTYNGTKGESRRLEGFMVSKGGALPGVDIEYMVHIQGIGDTAWTREGNFIGTGNPSRCIEGIAFRLTGSNAKAWDILYWAHLQDTGDTDLCRNGVFCGARGQSRRIEGFYVVLVPRLLSFNVKIRNTDPWGTDGCGHRFQLTGSTITLKALVSNIQTPYPLKTTTFLWHLPGGVLPAVPDDKASITITLPDPGHFLVIVDVEVTAEIVVAGQVIAISNKLSVNFEFDVLTDSQAKMAMALCNLWQDTLPIHRFVFPEDRMRRRLTASEEKWILSTSKRISRMAGAFVQKLNDLTGKQNNLKTLNSKNTIINMPDATEGGDTPPKVKRSARNKKPAGTRKPIKKKLTGRPLQRKSRYQKKISDR